MSSQFPRLKGSGEKERGVYHGEKEIGKKALRTMKRVFLASNDPTLKGRKKGTAEKAHKRTFETQSPRGSFPLWKISVIKEKKKKEKRGGWGAAET